MAKTRFHTILQERVAEEVSKRMRELADGKLTDFTVYRQLVGQIQGFEGALKLCDDIEKEFDQQ